MSLLKQRNHPEAFATKAARPIPECTDMDLERCLDLQDGVAAYCLIDDQQIEDGRKSIRLPGGTRELADQAFAAYNSGEIIKAVLSLLLTPGIRANQLKKEIIRSERFLPPEVRRLKTTQERCNYMMREQEHSRLLRLILPADLTVVHPDSFPSLLESIEVHPDNPVFCSVDGVLFSKDRKTLVRYPGLRENRNYAIPEWVEAVAPGAFRNCFIDTITIPSAIKTLDPGIFSHSRYDAVILSDGVERIGTECFRDCSVRCLELPKSLKEIGDAAFAGCSGLSALSCHDGEIALGSGLFSRGEFRDVDWWCWSVIPRGAFVNCKLKKITIPQGVKSIEDYAFAGCCQAKEIMLPDSIEEIGENAFDEGPAYSQNIQLPSHLERYLFRLPVCSTVNRRSRLHSLQEWCSKQFEESRPVLEKQKKDVEIVLGKLNMLQIKQKNDLRAQLTMIDQLLERCAGM